jgi:hypothetical protein
VADDLEFSSPVKAAEPVASSNEDDEYNDLFKDL